MRLSGRTAAASAADEGAPTEPTDAPDYERSIHDALENVRRMCEGDPRRVPGRQYSSLNAGSGLNRSQA